MAPPPARRLGLPHRRLRALGGLEAAAQLGEIRGAAGLSRLRRGGAAGRPASPRCPSCARRTGAPERVAELDALCDASSDQPRRQPRQPHAGARLRGDVGAGVPAPELAALDEAVRGRRCAGHLAPLRRGAAGARASRVETRSASTSTWRCAAWSRRRCGSGSRPARGAAPPARAGAAGGTGCSAACGRAPARRRRAAGAAARSVRRRTIGSTRGSSSPEVPCTMPDDHDHAATTTRTPRPTSCGRTGLLPRAGSPAPATSARAPSPSGSAGRSAAARPRWCSRSAARCATAPPRRRDQRHLHARGRRVPAPQRGAAGRSASARSRPAAARTPRSARTSATTCSRSSS